MPNSINIALCQSNTNRLMVLANENVAILLSSSLNKSEPAQVEPLPVSERFGLRMISSSKSTLHEALWCPKTLRLSNWESLKFFGIQTLYFDSIESKHSIQNPTPTRSLRGQLPFESLLTLDKNLKPLSRGPALESTRTFLQKNFCWEKHCEKRSRMSIKSSGDAGGRRERCNLRKLTK